MHKELQKEFIERPIYNGVMNPKQQRNEVTEVREEPRPMVVPKSDRRPLSLVEKIGRIFKVEYVLSGLFTSLVWVLYFKRLLTNELMFCLLVTFIACLMIVFKYTQKNKSHNKYIGI